MAMKRVVDYPRLYDSAKLAALPSDDLRAEYVWLLGMAGPNGSFEWSERRLWAAAYASVRDKTTADLGRYLQAFLDAGLLVKWEQDGKTWGYFTGSEKPGRLPRDSWKKRFAKSGGMAPAPPATILDRVAQHGCNSHATSVSDVRQVRDGCTVVACNKRAEGVSLSESLSESVINPLAHSLNELGGGDPRRGISGNGGSQPAERTPGDASNEKRLTPAKRAILVADLYGRYPKKVGKDKAYKAIGEAIVAVAKAGATDTHPDFAGDEQATAQWLGSRVDLYAQSAQARQPDKSKVPYPASWFNAGRYDDDTTQWEYVGFENGFRGQQQTPIVAQRPADQRLKDQLARYRAEHPGQERVRPWMKR